MRALLLASAFALFTASPAAAALERDPDDEVELSAMRSQRPHAVALIEKGEALGAAGSLWDASTLFRQAEAESPNSALPWRRECEALIALGRRAEAVAACAHAVQNRRANVNVRALVRALVDGPAGPTLNDLYQALRISSSVLDKGLAPTPVAMNCSIAERIGDGVMLQRCTEELERIAPNDPQTRRARGLLQAQCPLILFWGGWLSILAVAIGTAGHALRRLVSKRWTRTAVAAAVAICCAVPAVARAEEAAPSSDRLSEWTVDDEHPEKSVPSEKARNSEPLQFGYWLQDVTLKATRAHAQGDYPAAARFYAALAQAVPDRAIAFIRMCQEYEAMGDIDKAIQTCGDALLVDGTTVADYTRFVDLVVSKPGELNAKEKAALAQVIEHMKEDPAGRSFVDDVECKVGVRTSNVAQLKECTAALAALAPDSQKTIAYEWALAILEGKLSQAEQLIDRGRAVGVAVDGMVRTTAAHESRRRWLVGLVLVAIALFLGGAGIASRVLIKRRGVMTPKTA